MERLRRSLETDEYHLNYVPSPLQAGDFALAR
jgi:hypothetical protein